MEMRKPISCRPLLKQAGRCFPSFSRSSDGSMLVVSVVGAAERSTSLSSPWAGGAGGGAADMTYNLSDGNRGYR